MVCMHSKPEALGIDWSRGVGIWRGKEPLFTADKFLGMEELKNVMSWQIHKEETQIQCL